MNGEMLWILGTNSARKYLQQDARWVFIPCISYPWLLETPLQVRDLNEQLLVCITVLGMSNFGWDGSGGSDNLSQTWLTLLKRVHASVDNC